MAAVRAAKQALRRELKRRLAALSEAEKLRQSRALTLRFLSHPRYASCRRLALFLSMRDEVRTEDIVRDALLRGKSCFIPRYRTSGGSHMDMLRLRSLQDLDALPLTAWNIRQPAEEEDGREEALSAGGLDLILMPGLGFDRSGRRLGRGKGFYDSYLQRCRRLPGPAPYTVALAFREQLVPEVPVDHNDVLIDEVLYEED